MVSCTFAEANKPLNFITSVAQGRTASRNITTGQNFLFWSLHSWELNWYQNKRYGDSKANYLQRVPYPKRALLEEDMVYVASVFKVLQSCGASTALAGKCSVTRSFVKRNVFMSQSFRCGSLKFIAFETTKQVSATQIGLHNCNTF